MIRRSLYLLLNRIIRSLKGNQYKLDPSIPLFAIIGISYRRFKWLVRSLFSGFSWRRSIFIGKSVELRSRHLIYIGRGVTLGNGVLIDGLSREGVRIGDNVNVGDFSRIEASGTITDLGRGISIGSNSGIGAFSFVGGAGGVAIGNDVIMGQWVSFHPENHNYDSLDLPIRLQGVNRQGIVVEDDCWIGAKVTFLDGAHVGKGCVIAAGAVVRGTIPPYSIAAGVPAKVVRSRLKESGN
jgi:acetyltransferase-like isoleucine patch superfamily enzyme